ncbi:hypothetical protein LX64_01382 [Chitinophaga skermanii]|uniref:Uncharacterized protein n=1 Tax=Chitinophaga skermanii TaxID=331697 RepID=A0A327QY97_9BACT|nr:hypothetical protein [Chitinophaga skermanii]RAJ08728.1 hypothetical protein LX64_01382 [Chitinophaga skermanii]
MNWKTIFRYIFVVFLVIIQALFLLAILAENTNSIVISAFIIVLSCLLLVTYIKVPLHHEDHLYEHILVALWIPVGALSSYYLNNHVHLGPVMAAGIVGTIASFLPNINKESHYLQQLPPAVYCGAFIGMSSPNVASSFMFILAASVFTGILLVLSKSLFSGVGGKLGTLAFAGVVITSYLFFLI